MPSIALKNVTKIYPNGKIAVKDFNLEIEKKKFVAVVGPSGCGKTTLLRLIAGLETPTQGEIYMDGTLVNALKPKDRGVTLVFQSFSLFPYMTAYENMAFGLKMSGASKAEIDVKVREAAKLLGIENELGYKPHELSGGQCRRISLGRSMVMRPRFFLLDEPFSGLDAKLKADLCVWLSSLYEHLDATFILVTHDQNEAMSLGESIVVMNEGTIIQSAPPRMLYDAPCNKFVAGFIGTPEMNFSDVKFDGDKAVIFGQEYGGVSEKAVTVGVRAEDIYITDGDFTVVNVKPIGKENLVYVDTFGKTVVVKTEKQLLRGDKVGLSLNRDCLHFFDRDGNRIDGNRIDNGGNRINSDENNPDNGGNRP